MKTVHWTDESLSDPEFDLFDSQQSILVIDLDKPEKKTTEQMIDDLVDVMIHWNTEKIYKETTANCQNFVMDVIDKVLNIKNLSENLHSSLVLDIIQKLKSGNGYSWEKLMEDKIYEKYRNIKTHKELNKYLLENAEMMGDDEKNFLKSFDRSFWLNEFCLKKKLNGKRQLLSEYETKLENYLWDDDKTLKKRIEATLEEEFFNHQKFLETKENLQKMKKLRHFYKEYDVKIVSDKQFKKDLFEILRYLWEMFVEYYKIKIPELESNLEKCESVKGKEVIKYMSSDEVKEDLFSGEEFPSFDEIMKYKDEHKNAFQGVFNDCFTEENYEGTLCPFKNPIDTGSIIKKFK